MTTAGDGRDRMLKRHEIVVRIIEANSRRLRLDNEINGLDIERRIAERNLAAGTNDEAAAALSQVQSQIAALREESGKLELERAWLEEALTEFDGGAADPGAPAIKAGQA